MARNLKTLGLVLIVALATTAVAASSASATYEFTSAVDNTFLTGVQEGKHKFTTAGQSIECTTATFSGTQLGSAADDLTVAPIYSECAYLGKTAHVTMNGCFYTLTGETAAGGSHGKFHIVCPAGKVIEFHLTNIPSAGQTCTLTIGAQTPNQGYTVTNNFIDTTIQTTVTGVKITPHGSGACLFLVTGTYTGATTFRGYSDAAHMQEVKIEAH